MITKIVPLDNGMLSIYDDNKYIASVSPEVLPLFLNDNSKTSHTTNREPEDYMRKYNNAVESYLSDAFYRGLSKETIKGYQKQLRYFGDFYSKKYNGNPTSVPSYDDIVEYRNSLIDKDLSISSVKTSLVVLQTFFSWSSQKSMGENRYMRDNPIDKYVFPKDKRDNSMSEHFLNANDIKKMWDNIPPVNSNISDWKWRRNYAITTLLLDAKIRNDELLNLRLSDIDFENKTLTVRCGKGGKKRVVSLTDISLTAISLYLKTGYRPKGCGDNDYLFGSTMKVQSSSYAEWHKATGAWLSKTVERQVKLVTGKSGFRSHSLRHTGAVMDLRNGITLERLKEELGHSSVTTTEIYAHSIGTLRDCDDAKEAYLKRDKQAIINKEMLKR